MPISLITLQRRHAELGRIRLGNKVGDGRGRPNKLDKFRFTSVSERYIRDLANLYGGQAREWDNNGIPSWEVFSDAKSIPVIAVKGGLSQWLELWSGGGCTRRCDGERETLTDSPCICEANGGDRLCKPTTRLSVMLPELDAIGVFRLESHGWNSAAEIPAVAELATFVGDLVPAELHLVERRAIKDGKTSRFVVPVLDLQIGTARLKEIVAAKVAGGALPPASSAALEGGRPQIAGGTGEVDAFEPFFSRLEAATSFEECQQVWVDAKDAGLVGEGSPESPRRGEFFEAVKARGQVLSSGAKPAEPDADGVYDAVVVDDGDADAVWQKCLAAGGRASLTLDDVTEEYARFSGGEAASVATAAQLEAFLVELESMAQAVSA